MAQADTGVIFPKSDIQHPMQAVFNSPVTPNGVSKGVHGRETEEKIAGFSAQFRANAPLSSDHPNSSQPLPPLLRVEMREDFAITDRPVLSDLKLPVAFLHAAIRLPLESLKAVLLRHRKRDFDLFIQAPLVVFEGERIVALVFDNLSGDLGLRSYGINRHNASIKG